MPFRATTRNLFTSKCINKISHFVRNDFVLVGVICAILLISLQPIYAQVFKTQQEALKEAFSNSDSIDRKVLFLTEDEAAQIQQSAKVKVESKIVTYYAGSKTGSITGYAFFETNIVRTKPETFMIILSPNGKIKYIEVLAFYEPLDYLPTSNWFELFTNKILSDQLWPKRDIHNITGATLSVQAITQGVRKMLAVYQVAIARGEFN